MRSYLRIFLILTFITYCLGCSSSKSSSEGGATSSSQSSMADASSTQVEDIAATEEDTAAPLEDTAAPLEDTAAPLEDTAAPEEDTAAPEEDTAAPEEDTAEPEEDAVDSGEDVMAPQPGEHRVLFVGNSYTSANQLHQIYANLTNASTPSFEAVETNRVTSGGYQMIRHANDAANPETRLGSFLDPNNSDAPQWSHVVLQGQSQIAGFPSGNAQQQEFVQGVGELHQRITALGAKTALLMTWGRRDGDSRNPDLYPDFLTMQARLAQGYNNAAQVHGSAATPILVIPAGLAWKAIYDNHIANDEDPLVAGRLFFSLYASDGSHPALPGSYLTACTVFAALTGRPASLETWVPSGLDDVVAAKLREAADLAVGGE